MVIASAGFFQRLDNNYDSTYKVEALEILALILGHLSARTFPTSEAKRK
jgi:hypothetical protein